MDKALRTFIVDSGLILTPNARLARNLQADYVSRHEERSSAHILRPIIALSTWIRNRYDEAQILGLCPAQTILSDEQGYWIWKSIVQSSSEIARLPIIDVNNVARQSFTAWQMHQRWNSPAINDTELYSIEVQAWMSWRRQFEAHLVAHEYRCAIQLPTLFTTLLKQRDTALDEWFNEILPDTIGLYEFNEQAPYINDLILTLKQRTHLHEYRYQAHTTRPKQVCFSDDDAELDHIARWAYQHHANHPNKRIACIFTNLQSQRTEIIRCFDRYFRPANDLHQDERIAQYTITGGTRLDEHACIRVIRHVINAIAYRDDDALARLIASPYIEGALREQGQRAMLDNHLRASANKVSQLLSMTQWMRSNTPLLAEAILPLIQQPADKVATKTLSDWIQWLNQVLNQLGWPGERQLTSTEYQLVSKWYEVLNTIVTYEAIIGTCELYTFVSLLHECLSNTLFQIEAQTYPIQVLGTLEAYGQRFDEVWFAACDYNQWPQMPAPNPFLPYELQKQLQMPHADHERELHFASEYMADIAHKSSAVYYSYAQADADQKRLPSALISDFEAQSPASWQWQCSQSTSEQIHSSSQCETYQDNQGNALLDTSITNGVATLKSFIACPFKAFAQFRLNSRGLEEYDTLVNPLQRGQIIHRCLELFWQRVRTQTQLKAYTHEQQMSHTEDCIDQTLQEYASNDALNQALLTVEKQRLNAMFADFIALEMARGQFEVVSTESSYELTVGPLTFNTRIDRIDKTPAGYLLVDYKSGEMNINTWYSDPPDDPQMPLYLTHLPVAFIGAVYCQLKTGAIAFKGVVSQDEVLPSIQSEDENEWQSSQKKWQHALTTAAKQYATGTAEATPRYEHLTCQYCDQQPLCRYHFEED